MNPKVIPITDEHLLEGCRKKDRQSQRRLYERYFETMTFVCYRYAKDKEIAHDLVHEGFIKVFKNIHSFKNKGSLEGWIRRVMVNVCLDYLRREKRFVGEVPISEAADSAIDENAINNLEAEYILEKIAELPDPLRTVFNLYIIEGYPHKEIAKLLGFGASTSRAYLTEARKILKKKLGPTFKRERQVNHG
ncbi:MAG: RNA polymerase sigma factor [Bacteroidia bacterium]|nr:RNA polymerase sigma factor [Bacteroidia bacterium]